MEDSPAHGHLDRDMDPICYTSTTQNMFENLNLVYGSRLGYFPVSEIDLNITQRYGNRTLPCIRITS